MDTSFNAETHVMSWFSFPLNSATDFAEDLVLYLVLYLAFTLDEVDDVDDLEDEEEAEEEEEEEEAEEEEEEAEDDDDSKTFDVDG
jgi:ABC-type Zn2+ transport system substrate-binding protein/surface adhesin